MYILKKTKEFASWFEKLKDRKAKAKILVRLTQAELGLDLDGVINEKTT